MKKFITLFLAILIWTVVGDESIAADPDLQFTQISNLRDVTDIANAGDGSERLFLVRRYGLIKILEDGQELEGLFLNIQNRVSSTGEEMGLLSMAFAPDYKTSGYFYVLYVAERALMLDRLKVSDDPNIADASSRKNVLWVELTSWTNNGGRIRFGPDGMLYLGIGDDGDYEGYSSTIAQDGSYLNGKLLRIDVDPAHGTYAIPPDNPFVGNAAYRDEIWALGLRNPWRTSFDMGTGDLFIADVGEEELEEINFQGIESTGGENYGWSMMEGTMCVAGGSCNQAGLTLPISEYPHESNDGNDNCWVIGGEVYRGDAYPNLKGTYLYGDYCSGNIWSLARDGNQWLNKMLTVTDYAVTTFGLAEDGSIYLAADNAGVFLVSDGEVKNEPDFSINSGLTGAWYNPETSGQGQLIDLDPESQYMFLAWFTFTDGVSPNPNEQHWFTAQGNYNGNTAQLVLYETLGGQFDAPQEVSTDPVGEVVLSFTDCETGQMDYTIETLALQGSIPLQRAIPGSGNSCEDIEASAFAIESIDINAGMDGAWYDPTAPGQGFLFDAYQNTVGGNLIFVAWFTYGDDTVSGQRWLTAQGNIIGPVADIDISETTGGSFDDPKAINTDKVGTMSIDFRDCSNAKLDYSLTDDGVEGEINITRAVPNGQALCEELNGVN